MPFRRPDGSYFLEKINDVPMMKNQAARVQLRNRKTINKDRIEKKLELLKGSLDSDIVIDEVQEMKRTISNTRNPLEIKP